MLSQQDADFLKKELKILKPEIRKWESSDFERLLGLLKVQDILQPFLSTHQVKHLLNIEYLEQHVEPTLNETIYFPYHKFKSILELLRQMDEQLQEHYDDLQNSVMFEKSQNVLGNPYIEFEQPLLLRFKEVIDSLGETLIIELSNIKIITILKKISFKQQYIELVKAYNCDGFTFVCTLTDHKQINEAKGIISEEDINILLSLSVLFLTQYYRQMFQFLVNEENSSLEKKITNVIAIEDSDMSSSTQFKKIEESIEFSSSSIAMGSEFSNSKNDYGESEYGESEYGLSERGSVLAESVYGRGSFFMRESFFEQQTRKSRISDMYDPGILFQLQQASMDLPFNLLNLEPLQTIKLRELASPYSKQGNKNYHWPFSIQGAKFGRDKENDLRFPDELSISSKHAQIFFRDDNFYLQDLGSKTGTFLLMRGITKMNNETYIQLSPDTQIIFRILQKHKAYGVIRAEVKKPENIPNYKVPLRDNYKIKIGRSEECHIRIDLPSIADKHAEIYYRNEIFSYKDCSKVNLGSWKRLSERSVRSEGVKLVKGDIFRLSSKKTFCIEEMQNQLIKNDTKS